MQEHTAQALIAMAEDFVARHIGLRALAVCGSWARGNPRPDSDLDLLILATDPGAWWRDQGWVARLPYGAAGLAYRGHETACYGVVRSAHVALDPAAALELSIAPLSWMEVDPVDPGTRHVVADAFRIVIDKGGGLSRLAALCRGDIAARRPTGKAVAP